MSVATTTTHGVYNAHRASCAGRGEKGTDCVPSAVRQDVVAPALQLVRTADGIEDLLAWLQAEVVGVVEAQAAARLLQLLGRDALKRGLRGDRHEDGEVDGPVGQGEDGRASSCGLSLVWPHLSVSQAAQDGGAAAVASKHRKLTEHLATSSKVSAPCVADLAVDAIFLDAHMLLPRERSCRMRVSVEHVQ